ncbi:hypothetical protein CSUB01_02945 [Colletotrichum sublineola]|uniref:Uncharacterized protein n=1 Tax=Colletotrichum sublineola TaxID=1173701 RepID=A0A066XTH3_COLSU|nr:hypothetical protein CSUB01_02945 [Colletotrichum sublineola]
MGAATRLLKKRQATDADYENSAQRNAQVDRWIWDKCHLLTIAEDNGAPFHPASTEAFQLDSASATATGEGDTATCNGIGIGAGPPHFEALETGASWYTTDEAQIAAIIPSCARMEDAG